MLMNCLMVVVKYKLQIREIVFIRFNCGYLKKERLTEKVYARSIWGRTENAFAEDLRVYLNEIIDENL